LEYIIELAARRMECRVLNWRSCAVNVLADEFGLARGWLAPHVRFTRIVPHAFCGRTRFYVLRRLPQLYSLFTVHYSQLSILYSLFSTLHSLNL
jgi:hypothetical protein